MVNQHLSDGVLRKSEQYNYQMMYVSQGFSHLKVKKKLRQHAPRVHEPDRISFTGEQGTTDGNVCQHNLTFLTSDLCVSPLIRVGGHHWGRQSLACLYSRLTQTFDGTGQVKLISRRCLFTSGTLSFTSGLLEVNYRACGKSFNRDCGGHQFREERDKHVCTSLLMVIMDCSHSWMLEEETEQIPWNKQRPERECHTLTVPLVKIYVTNEETILVHLCCDTKNDDVSRRSTWVKFCHSVSYRDSWPSEDEACSL